MTIFEKLQPLLSEIEETLQTQVKDDFPRTLREPIRYFLETPGKKIRPLLTLLGCRMVSGDYHAALPAAAGIELFHDFTLIHDDIMDRDELRRGRPTVHSRWDEGTAILAGDALVGMASDCMTQCDALHLPRVMQLFSEALIKVCEGQALDKEFELEDSVSLENYLDMISKKTAWLFRLSLQLGAIIGGGDEEQIQNLADFGYQLGMGFQIQDDLLDLVADESKLGKKVGSDLRMDKKTYLSICYGEYARQHGGSSTSLNQLSSAAEAKEMLQQSGVLAATEAVVREYFNHALQSLGRVQALDEQNHIYQIVRFLQTRQY